MIKDTLKVHFSSESNEWETPIDLFNELNNFFNFTLDACASDTNHKVDNYYTIKDNSLQKDWLQETVWINPPYGRQIGRFCEKAYKASLNGATVVMLIPARPDTKYWHNYVFKASYLLFFKGRLKFKNGDKNNSAPFPSALVVFSNKYTKNDLQWMIKLGKIVDLNEQ